jgi:hypothetical protein
LWEIADHDVHEREPGLLNPRPQKDRKRREDCYRQDERAMVDPPIREPCPKCGQWCVSERKSRDTSLAERALEAYRDDPAYWLDLAVHLSRLSDRQQEFREAIGELERLGVKIGFRLTWKGRA